MNYRLKYGLVCLAVATLVALPAAADSCVHFGKDDAAVERVQSSWEPAERAMDSGEYSAALSKLQATAAALPRIGNAFTRECVGEGAGIRIASASAGKAFLADHPADRAGAKAAAARAWRAFPMRHDCP